VQAGRVDDDQLGVFPVHDAADDPPRRLRPVAGDRDLGPDEGVGEGGLADVGAADQAREAGPEDGPGLPFIVRPVIPPGAPGPLVGRSRLVHLTIVGHPAHRLGARPERRAVQRMDLFSGSALRGYR
jgi:hypothetical protein